MTEQKYAIIVAGGKGTRFDPALAKQFFELKGRPVLVHTIEKFLAYSDAIRIVVVLPAADLDRWAGLQEQYFPSMPLTVCTGGATRFESVRNGLQHVGEDGLIAVHDGVRPLVTPALIRAGFDAAVKFGCAVPAVALKESLRQISANGGTVAVDRANFRLVQTPQMFQAPILHNAYAAARNTMATDDAAVVEEAGYAIHLFEGRYDNIKITTPDDLVLATALMSA